MVVFERCYCQFGWVGLATGYFEIEAFEKNEGTKFQNFKKKRARIIDFFELYYLKISVYLQPVEFKPVKFELYSIKYVQKIRRDGHALGQISD